jgi:hypothetical protein
MKSSYRFLIIVFVGLNIALTINYFFVFNRNNNDKIVSENSSLKINNEQYQAPIDREVLVDQSIRDQTVTNKKQLSDSIALGHKVDAIKINREIEKILLQSNEYLKLERYISDKHSVLIEKLLRLYTFKNLSVAQNTSLINTIHNMNGLYVDRILSESGHGSVEKSIADLNDALKIRHLDKVGKEKIISKINSLKSQKQAPAPEPEKIKH